MSTSKILTLKSSDGEIFEVPETVAIQSQISFMVEDGCVGTKIHITNATSVILAKVIEYCKKHVVILDGDGDSSSSMKDELRNWDAEFMKNIDKPMLFDLINAANYLNIKSLFDLTCQTIADMITGKTVDEIRIFSTLKMILHPKKKRKCVLKTIGLMNDYVNQFVLLDS